MSGKTGRIENDDQFDKSCTWLVTEAERLEKEEDIHDPLIKPEDKARIMRKYNLVEAGILDYQRRMREGDDKKTEPKPIAEPQVQPEPEPIPPKPTAKLSDFLDD